MLQALIVTWSFDHYTVELLQALPVPVAIRAIPGIRSGSIVGSQQLASVLADIDLPYRLFYGGLDDPEPAERRRSMPAPAPSVASLRGAGWR